MMHDYGARLVGWFLAGLLLACCSAEDGTAPNPASTTLRRVESSARAGPYSVGVVTLAPEGGSLVEVWYPAARETNAAVSYDVRDFVPDAVRALLTEDIPTGYTFTGKRDAAGAHGEFPVVLFSHGFGGMRLQSSFLTSHLASHGMVVAAPDHPGRDLRSLLAGTSSTDQASAVADLLASLGLVVAESERSGSPLRGRIDAEQIAAVGHSAGGATALLAAADRRIDAYVALASGKPADDTAYPERPSLFVAGAVDAVVPAETVSHPTFEAAPSPAWYVEIEATGHNGFDDYCTFGDGTGIIGIAARSGLGPWLDSQPHLRTLGQDGCVPPAAPVDQAHPIIRAAVTAWLRHQLGLDDELAGFDDGFLDGFQLRATAEHH